MKLTFKLLVASVLFFAGAQGMQRNGKPQTFLTPVQNFNNRVVELEIALASEQENGYDTTLTGKKLMMARKNLDNAKRELADRKKLIKTDAPTATETSRVTVVAPVAPNRQAPTLETSKPAEKPTVIVGNPTFIKAPQTNVVAKTNEKQITAEPLRITENPSMAITQPVATEVQKPAETPVLMIEGSKVVTVVPVKTEEQNSAQPSILIEGPKPVATQPSLTEPVRINVTITPRPATVKASTMQVAETLPVTNASVATETPVITTEGSGSWGTTLTNAVFNRYTVTGVAVLGVAALAVDHKYYEGKMRDVAKNLVINAATGAKDRVLWTGNKIADLQAVAKATDFIKYTILRQERPAEPGTWQWLSNVATKIWQS